MAAPWRQQARSPLPRALGLKAAQGVGLSPPLRACWSRGRARATAGKEASFCRQQVLDNPRLLAGAGLRVWPQCPRGHSAQREPDLPSLLLLAKEGVKKKTANCLLPLLLSKESNIVCILYCTALVLEAGSR